MRRGLGSGGSRWSGWSKEDEDLMACQVISTFFWIFLVLLINFFVLHRSNTIPTAEARWAEPRTALQPPPVLPPEVRLAMRTPRVPWERPPEFERDDYKPNYYFLYQDQVRILDFIPKKKVMVAKHKAPPQPPEKPGKKVIVPIQKPPPVTIPVQPEWVEMAMIEEPMLEEKKKPREVEKPPERMAPGPIQVAMVKDLDLDMEIARDVPMPVISKRPKEPTPKSVQKIRLSAVDVDMNISVEERSERKKPPRSVSDAHQEDRSPIVASSAAQYVSLPMEIDTEEKATPVAARASARQLRKGALGHRFVAAGPALPTESIPMSLEFEGTGQEVSRFKRQGTIKGEKRTARLLALTRKRLGGIDLPVAIVGGESEKTGLPKLGERPIGRSEKRRMVRVTARTEKGSIPLGEPLAFALADVGEETHTGSAYIRQSTRLMRLLEEQGLPDTPVTVSVARTGAETREAGGLTAISYSRDQVVLQYANGKQQIVRLEEGEPYPHFELRSTARGARRIPVGTKLQEITSCLSTLEHILKE